MIKEIPLFGELSSSDYRTLQASLLAAKDDPSISSVLLDIDSAGGTIEMAYETAAVVKEVARVKPVYAYTQSKMLSAAYWIASQATKVFASPTSKIGSIGVLAVHIDQSAKNAREGVVVTLLRSAEQKGVPNSYEPLSDEAKRGLQQSIDALHEQFVADVKNSRLLADDAEWATGKVFSAAEAKALGLIDDIVMPHLLKQHITSLNSKTEDNMDKSILESFASVAKDLFSRENKEHEERRQQLIRELEEKQRAIKEYEERLAAAEREREELRKLMREKEIRERLLKSRRFYGAALEKTAAFAMSLDDQSLEKFMQIVEAMGEVSTEAKFTSGATIADDSIVEKILKA